jgi:hypothetical protein
MKRSVLNIFVGLVAATASSVSFAQDSSSTAEMPSSGSATIVRLLPVAGASSFTSKNDLDNSKFNQGFSAGLLVDLGPAYWAFETGVLALSAQQTTGDGTSTVHVGTYGIPLFAKYSISGNPHKTVFLKAGAMPFQATGGADNKFDVLGVVGLGGDIPLGSTASIVLDATYNRLFKSSTGDETDYKGIALLAGLNINL